MSDWTDIGSLADLEATFTSRSAMSMATACAWRGLMARCTPSKTAAPTTTPLSTMLPSKIPKSSVRATARGSACAPARRSPRLPMNPADLRSARNRRGASRCAFERLTRRKRLTLIRHANAEQDADVRDFERPLSRKGAERSAGDGAALPGARPGSRSHPRERRGAHARNRRDLRQGAGRRRAPAAGRRFAVSRRWRSHPGGDSRAWVRASGISW